MASYCTVVDVENILTSNVNIGTNVLRGEVNVTTANVEFWIAETAGVIDSYVSSLYRIPLILYKEPDFSQNPVTFTERYPHPVILINARLAAANIYDKIIMANQEPNVSDWGKNQRSLAYDDLSQIQSGAIQLKGQVYIGLRFVRQELRDAPRAPSHPDVQPHSRSAGE